MIINSINIKSMKSMKHSDYHGKLLRLAMVFVALFLCGTMAYAQTDRMISGIVVDENGDPLPAAHIRQVSQTKGDVIAAQITVGLCLLPISFWMTSTGRTPPCSEPMTGLKSA